MAEKQTAEKDQPTLRTDYRRDDEKISNGWDNAGFPRFSLESRRPLYCIDCGADGGDDYLIYAKDSDEAREVLLHATKDRYRKRDMTQALMFDPPSSWCVSVLADEPRSLAAWAGPTCFFPSARTVREMAQRIHVEGVLSKPCSGCGHKLPEEWSRIQFEWEWSTLGDWFFHRCTECGEVIALSNDDF